MKIAYLSDKYAWDQFGVKRSLLQTLASRKDVVAHFFDFKCFHPDVHFAPMAKKMPYGKLYKTLMRGEYTHVFFASSCLSFEPELMGRLKERSCLVGFGFSDPRHVHNTRQHWMYFDAYFSLSEEIVEEAGALGIPAKVMLPSIHPGFHDMYSVDHKHAEYDAVFFGNIQTHPDAELRREFLHNLQARGCNVLTVGRGGLVSHVEGPDAMKLLASARVGINIMNSDSTLPHRVFEYTAANNCLLTTPTSAISSCFQIGQEALSLADPDIVEKIADVEYCARIAQKGRLRCLDEHSIVSRVDDIFTLLTGL